MKNTSATSHPIQQAAQRIPKERKCEDVVKDLITTLVTFRYIVESTVKKEINGFKRTWMEFSLSPSGSQVLQPYQQHRSATMGSGQCRHSCHSDGSRIPPFHNTIVDRYSHRVESWTGRSELSNNIQVITCQPKLSPMHARKRSSLYTRL